MQKKVFISRTLFIILLYLIPLWLLGQPAFQINRYQDLSSFSYKKEKDSIRKKWSCPLVFPEYEAQDRFKEIWKSRTDFLVSAIEDNDFVKDPVLYNYTYDILTSLVKANPELISAVPLLIIDRSSSVNAYSIGGNVLLVNAGLISFCRTREELALVLAHELSHEILKHTDRAMRERAQLLASDAYKKSLEKVLESRFERLTRLQKIIAGYSFSRNRHNRYHESEADSLGIRILDKAGIPFHPQYFLRLDSADNAYMQELTKPVKEYFSAYGFDATDAWFLKRTRGLSTKAYNFSDSTVNEDSLKTHPDCAERYLKTKSLASADLRENPIPENVREEADRQIIWNLYSNQQLTSCLYRILLQKDKGKPDYWYDFMFYNVISGLNFAGQHLNRFNAIAFRPKELVSGSYFSLQTMLEQIPGEDLALLQKKLEEVPFWSKTGDEEKEFRNLFSVINDENSSSAQRKNVTKNFINHFPESIYCEIAEKIN